MNVMAMQDYVIMYRVVSKAKMFDIEYYLFLKKILLVTQETKIFHHERIFTQKYLKVIFPKLTTYMRAYIRT